MRGLVRRPPTSHPQRRWAAAFGDTPIRGFAAGDDGVREVGLCNEALGLAAAHGSIFSGASCRAVQRSAAGFCSWTLQDPPAPPV